MVIKRYRVRLLDADLLAVLDLPSWHIDIVASDMASAWRKFKVQKRAPAWHFTSAADSPRASDYDISLLREKVQP